jgi:hypothetical protein
MKNSKFTFVLILAFLSTSVSLLANSPYEKAMKSAMEELGKCNSLETFNQSGNTFDRIGNQDNTKWQPVYYSAYTRVIMAAITEKPEEKDAYLDVAQKHLERLGEIADHDASERLALEGFLHMIRISVDPATRGQEYSGKSATALSQALAIDGQNPRAMYMMGQVTFGTAQFFGNDTSDACNMFKTSITLFEQEASDDARGFDPSWGLKQAQTMLERCGG